MLLKNNSTLGAFINSRENAVKMTEKKESLAETPIVKYKQCPNKSVPYLVGDNSKQNKRIIIKARCKLWDCPYCAEINKSNHMNRVAIGLYKLDRLDKPLEFVTITCHEKWRGYEKSLQNWRKNSGKLLARYRRREKRERNDAGDYIYIPEYHKDKSLHIHGVFVGSGENRWWKNNARASGLGYMAESTKLTSILQGINYILKYITKEIGKPSASKGVRRICYSQGFPHIHSLPSAMEWHVLDSKTSIESAIIDGLILKQSTVEFDGITFNSTDDL